MLDIKDKEEQLGVRYHPSTSFGEASKKSGNTSKKSILMWVEKLFENVAKRIVKEIQDFSHIITKIILLE